MIVTRTPLRISLFGGGTDYPEWYMRNRGAVIGLAINKYVYVTAMPLSPLHPYKFRLYWSKIERCQTADEIEHPVVREYLRYNNINTPTGFSIIADLPARNGLGSSSAFTVGFINAMHPHAHTPLQLARHAAYVERAILKENGGHQDQYLCSLGGFRRFDFHERGVTTKRVQGGDITSSLFLLHTGVTRTASNVSAEQKYRTIDGLCDAQLNATLDLVDEAETILNGNQDPQDLAVGVGRLMHEAWRIKRTMSSQITNPRIDELYEECLRSGALAGKICGAGAGGFFLAIVPEHAQQCFLERMERRVPVIRVGLDTQGSIVWPEPSQQAI